MSRFTMLPLLALALPAAARAGDDYKAEAEESMGLSFDLDTVQGRLKDERTNAPPAPAPPAAYDDGSYNQPQTPPPPLQLPLEPNSTVDQVVVFKDRALVTRYRDVHVPSGASSITFEGLPFGIQADSLYAQLRKGDVKIVGVELESGATKVDDNADATKAIRAQSLPLANQLGDIRDHIEALLAQRDFLRAAVTASGGDHPLPGLDQIKGTFGYVGDTEQAIAAELRKQQDAAKDIDKKLSPLLVKLDNPQATGMTVRIDVESADARDVELGLRYQVFGAQWYPSYDARLDDAASRVNIEYYGVVSQTTGEDWTNASLLLSTADPSVSGELPSLQSWYLGRDASGAYNPGVIDQLQSGKGDWTAPSTSSSSVTAAGGDVQTTMIATVQGSGAAVFAIPGRRTIVGTGSEQRLPVGTQSYPATMELSCVPKVVPEVYRKAHVKYAGDVPMLPGTVASFVGADYVGSGNVNAVVPGEDLALSFGTDDSIKVQRQLVSREEEGIGAGKKTVRYTFHFRITLQNFGKEARTVLVTDQIPVSEIDKVEVETLPGTTPGMPTDPTDPAGIDKWTVTVAPGATQAIDLEFSVTAPKEEAQQLQQLEDMY